MIQRRDEQQLHWCFLKSSITMMSFFRIVNAFSRTSRLRLLCCWLCSTIQDISAFYCWQPMNEHPSPNITLKSLILRVNSLSTSQSSFSKLIPFGDHYYNYSYYFYMNALFSFWIVVLTRTGSSDLRDKRHCSCRCLTNHCYALAVSLANYIVTILPYIRNRYTWVDIGQFGLLLGWSGVECTCRSSSCTRNKKPDC